MGFAGAGADPAMDATPPPPERYLSAEWGGRCVVFDRQTGHTHALDEVSSALWRLPTQERTLDAAGKWLASDFREISAQELVEMIDASLAELRRAGLIE